MNKYLTFAGTQPVYLGDIDFIQNASSQVQNLLLRALLNSASGTANSILQGVEFSTPSAGTIAWTAGVVALGGEVLPIEAGSLTASGVGELYFHVSSTLSGGRTFKDGASHDCFETRVAVINKTSSDGVAVSSVDRLHENKKFQGSGNGYTDGDVTYKDGLWLASIDFNIPNNQSTLASSVLITGLSSSQIATLSAKTFIAQVIVYNSTDGYAAQLIECELSPDSDHGQLLLSFEYAGPRTAYGTGTLDIILPVF